MTTTLHALSGNVGDLLAEPVDPRHTIAWVETNAESGAIVDTTSGGKILVGSPRIDIADDGSFSVALPTTAGATIPTGFQYRVWVEYRTVFGGAVKKARWTSGWFSLTAPANLKDVVEESYAPPSYATQLTTALDAHAAALEAGLTSAALGDEDALLAAAVTGPTTATRAALNTAYVARAKAPTGVAATDTANLQAALAEIQASEDHHLPTGSMQVSALTELRLQGGHYRINAPLDFTLPGVNYLKIASEGRTIIEQVTAGEDIFDMSEWVLGVEVEGVAFIGGARHVVYGNPNSDGCQVKFTRCEFHNSADWTFEALLQGGVTNLSANVLFEGCKWSNNYRVLKNVLGCAVTVRESWVNVGDSAAPGAQFENHDELHFDRMYGVPPGAATPVDARWVDNYLQFFAAESRFGGENGGMPVVDNYGGPEEGYPYNFGSIVSIRNCHTAIGQTAGGRARYLVRFSDNVPQLLDITNNVGLTRDTDPFVIDALTFGLATYLAGYGANIRFYVTFGGNVGWGRAGLEGIPDELYTTPARVRFNAVPGLSVVTEDGVQEEGGLSLVNIAAGGPRRWRVAAGQEGVTPDRFTVRRTDESLDHLVLYDNWEIGSGYTGLAVLCNRGGVLALERLQIGAADSGGTGYRMIRIPN